MKLTRGKQLISGLTNKFIKKDMKRYKSGPEMKQWDRELA